MALAVPAWWQRDIPFLQQGFAKHQGPGTLTPEGVGGTAGGADCMPKARHTRLGSLNPPGPREGVASLLTGEAPGTSEEEGAPEAHGPSAWVPLCVHHEHEMWTLEP